MEKALEDYHRNIRSKDGRANECKKCVSDKNKIKRNTPEYKENRRKYNQRPEVKAKAREYERKPERIAQNKIKEAKRRKTPEFIAYREAYQADPAYKEYQRIKNINNHGLTIEQFDALLAAQGGVCAICKTDKPGGRGGFHIDHDHSCCPRSKSCGKCVRGLLCNNCNVGRGAFKDDPDLIKAALEYSLKPLRIGRT